MCLTTPRGCPIVESFYIRSLRIIQGEFRGGPTTTRTVAVAEIDGESIGRRGDLRIAGNRGWSQA